MQAELSKNTQLKHKIKPFLKLQENGLTFSFVKDDGWSLGHSSLRGGFLPHYLAVRCYSNIGIAQSDQLEILWKCPYENEQGLFYFLNNFIIMYSLIWMNKTLLNSKALQSEHKKEIAPSVGFSMQIKVLEWLRKMSTKYLTWLWNTNYGSVDEGNGTSPIEHVHSTTRGILSRQRSVGLDTVLKIITMALLQRTTNNFHSLPPIPAWHSNKAMKQITLQASKNILELWSVDRQIMESNTSKMAGRILFSKNLQFFLRK